MKSIKKLTAALVVMAVVIGMMGCKTHAHVHSWELTVTKSPTCVAKGSKTYTCSECGNERTEDIDALGWCETTIDAETLNGATSTSTYIYFGVFPRTIKASSVIINEAETITMGLNTYYKGNDGEWYVKVTADPCFSYTYDASDKYSDGTKITKGNTDYFKVEPIKWKVLTTDYNGSKKALLLAEETLIASVPYYVNSSDRTLGGKTIYANNYMYSTIRAYLNGKYESDDIQTTTYNNAGFLQTAFTAGAQALIAHTEVVNDGASTSDATGTIRKADGTVIKSRTDEGGNIVYYPDYTCANTTDKIFLLSEQEVTTTAYGFAAYNIWDTRIRVTTDYAKANYAYQNANDGHCGYWWLRSPFYNISSDVRIIEDDGYAEYRTGVGSRTVGVVPALSISLQ